MPMSQSHLALLGIIRQLKQECREDAKLAATLWNRSAEREALLSRISQALSAERGGKP